MPIADIVSPEVCNAHRPDRRHLEMLHRSSLGGGEIDFSIVVPAHNRPLGLRK
jgi:hypothetical protein